jgi:HNH endonuclease
VLRSKICLLEYEVVGDSLGMRMWHWDQGHLAYFDFDALKRISEFVIKHDFKAATKASLVASTGLSFAAPATHSHWRQYSRALKLSFLVSEIGDDVVSTPVAAILARPGAVICDEYLYFLVRATTDPSPALTGWTPDANFRYPLLFALKYLLTKVAIGQDEPTSINELIGAYVKTGFVGDEDDAKFIGAVSNNDDFEAFGKAIADDPRRQGRESLKVMSQFSFLQVRANKIIVSLAKEDAASIFEDATAIIGPRASDSEAEIRRLANLFKGGSTSDIFEYPNTTVSDLTASGFNEGTKVKKTHLVIERNSRLRRDFFALNTSAKCDVCAVDTKKTYPWTERVLDVHHLLPLSSGTRVTGQSTTFDDLVPVCPNCHRAIHRYYDWWLKEKKQLDFLGRDEARAVYDLVKTTFPGIAYA